MSRHLQQVDGRARASRLAIVGVVWIAGLVTGFYGLLGVAVRYGCGSNDKGLACTNSGSTVGILLVVAVIAVVTAATVLAIDRAPRLVAAIAACAIVALAACFVGARALLGTV